MTQTHVPADPARISSALNKLVDAAHELDEACGTDRTKRISAAAFVLEMARGQLLRLRDLGVRMPFAGARIIESIDACLFGDNDHSSAEVRRRALDACATRLLRLANGPEARSAILEPSERGRLACEVREHVRFQLDKPPEARRDLAHTVEIARMLTRASTLFPAALTDEERVERFSKAIRLLQRGRTETDEEFATRVVVACAKATGCKRPSSLFQLEDKAEKRKLRSA